MVGECGVAEEERLQQRGLPTMMLGDILGDDIKCVCGAEVRTDVTVCIETCFVCGRTLGKHFRPHEPRWNGAGNGIALMCRPCFKKENKRVQVDEKQGLSGERQCPEWEANGEIMVGVR